MKLSVDYKKSIIKVKKLEFKPNGVLITHEDDIFDLYSYEWIGKHRVVIVD